MGFRKLRARMTELDITQSQLSRKLGISLTTLNQKLNGKTQFTLYELFRICSILDIPRSDALIFFS